MAMREYGASFSSPTRVIGSWGACLWIVTAGMTPAGPAPRMTWWVIVFSKKKIAVSGDRYFVASGHWGSEHTPCASLQSVIRPPMTCVSSGDSEAQTRLGGCRGTAFRVPAARGVVLGQHLGQLADHALGGTGLGRFGQQALGQVVVLGGEAGGVVEFALHVPDALTDLLQLFGGELFVARGLQLRRQIGHAPGEGGEHAQARLVERGGGE